MATKYAALPDIDSAPDVYETPDTVFDVRGVPSIEDENPERGDDEHIDRTRLEPEKAAARFRNDDDTATVEPRTLAIRHRKALFRSYVQQGFESSEYEILPRRTGDVGIEETSEQRLRRLTYEIQELGEQMERESKDDIQRRREPPHAQISSQVAALRNQLLDLSARNQGRDGSQSSSLVHQVEMGKDMLRRLQAYKDREAKTKTSEGGEQEEESKTVSNAVMYELYYSPEMARIQATTRSADLEARLAAIEKAMFGAAGSINLEDFAAVMSEGNSLSTLVSRLDQHLAILSQPRHLEQISRKVKTLATDLDRVHELKSKEIPFGGGGGAGASRETESKIIRLFDLVGKLDPLVSLCPALLTRLRSLRALHKEASVFAESVRMIANDQTRIKEQVDGLQDVCTKLERSMSENNAIVTKNVESLEQRLSGLMKRVDRLGDAS